jgi:hypothetical protein
MSKKVLKTYDIVSKPSGVVLEDGIKSREYARDEMRYYKEHGADVVIKQNVYILATQRQVR